MSRKLLSSHIWRYTPPRHRPARAATQLSRFGERPEVAWLLPFSVDGMLVVASVAMVDDKRSGSRVRPAARVAFVAGVAASIAANIAAAQPTWSARVVAARPALALLLVVEMLSRSGRDQLTVAAAAEPAPARVAEVPEPYRPPHLHSDVPQSIWLQLQRRFRPKVQRRYRISESTATPRPPYAAPQQ